LFPVLLLFTSLSFAQHIVGDVTVGSEPRGVAVNAKTGNVYVADVQSGTISVLQGQSVTATIPVDTLPEVVAVDPNSNLVYAGGCNYLTGAGSMVVVIDGSTNKVVTDISLNDICTIGIQGIAVNPFAHRVYVSDYDENQEVVIDGSANTIMTRIDLAGGQPLGVDVDLRTARVWVPLDGPSGNVDIISGHSNTLLRTVTVGNVFLECVAINSSSRRVYVTSLTAPANVYVLDADQGTQVAAVPFGSFDKSDAVDPRTNLIFVTDAQNNQVGVIDGNTNTVAATVSLNGTFPSGVAVDPVTSLVYVTDFSSNQVEIMTEK
jgi:YVTN family beta-propeller protein